ncbi:MAG: hypothetical protein WCO56_07240 [Verrucomicrobiota bacterium]
MKMIPVLTVAAVLLPSLVLAQPGSPDGLTYKTGYSAITKIGGDLQKALKDKYKAMIHSQPVFLETDMMPFIKLTEYPDESKPLRAVFISVGFVDLMNHVAHAKAIDRIEKGYFEKYVAALAQESGDKELHEPPKLDNKKYWTEDMINEQLSSFNQMVGMVLAIELSHHYLGHFKKYAAQLDDTKGRPPPINNLLTPSEWDESMKAGCVNSLESGFGVDGIKALYDAINKMPQRPAWAAYFLPVNLKVDKVKKDLEKIEKKFFAGDRL